MSVMLQLSSLALRGAAHAAADLAGSGAAGAAGEAVVGLLAQRFTDHSKTLTRALDRAADRAWRAVEVALAGRSWWDRCQLALRSAEERGFREQVQAFLQHNPLDGADGFGPDFRAQALAQLQAARKAGLLAKGPPPPDQLARHVGSLARFGDPAAVVEAQYRAVASVAEALRGHGYDALATFLALRPASGPPVLAAAVHYFFEREVQRDRDLFQGLSYARLEGLAHGQSAGFASLADALDERAERLESLLGDVRSVVVQTHEDVLDVKAEMQRQGRQLQELSAAVLDALRQHQLDKRSLHAGDSLSVRDEGERRLVKDLVRRYRALPAEERRTLPALLNAVGKLEVMAGEFESAERDFRELAALSPDGPAKAEAAHNAYLAGLERRAWPDALAALQEAVGLDPARYAPFPAEKFEAERILGAGGFGVAFLCRNTRSGGRVVVKTLRRDAVDRDLNEVFREAQALEELEHPAIIRVRDCDYADAGRTRPYLVMDYFAGQTLGEHVRQNGPLPPGAAVPLLRLVAEGLQRAHEHGILHRDVKPDNLLVRASSPLTSGKATPLTPNPCSPPAEEGEGRKSPPLSASGRGPGGGVLGQGGVKWDAKLIDFGLALRARAGKSTMRASLERTLEGSSIAGTIEYAAPEQMGKLPGVAVGPYSDVYGFGKTACFALFGTSQPTFQHWQQLPPPLAELLGRCLNEQPAARPQSFAAVLSDLGRLEEFRQPAGRPAPAPRILDAQPAPDVVGPARAVPVLEEVAPATRRQEPPRPRRRFGPEPRPAGRLRGAGLVVVVVAIPVCAVVLAVVVASLRFRGGNDNSGVFTQPPLFGPQGHPNIPKINFPGMAPALSTKPVGPDEFPKVLAELQNKPALERLRELASRLAATAPTESQKKRHDNVKLMRAMPGGPGGAALAVQEKRDEIAQVSEALNPLLRSEQRTDHMLAAQAMLKWGTPANIDALSTALSDTNERGVFNVRITLCKALAAIGDPRGVPAVAGRLEDHWDRSNGLTSILISFGKAAEPEMIKVLRSDRDWSVKQEACAVLKAVGTKDCLDALDETVNDAKHPFVTQAAKAAMAAVETRAGLGAASTGPVGPGELPRLLAALGDKPSPRVLRALAVRLEKTTPTAQQQERHDRLVEARARPEKPAADALARLEREDEILQASRALNGLLLGGEGRRPDPLLAARALRKWGTPENVGPLLAALPELPTRGFDNPRFEVFKTLAAIGDPRGVPAVAERLSDLGDRGSGLSRILIAFGKVAEPEMVKILQSDKDWTVKKEACTVLKAVGTTHCLDALEEARADAGNRFLTTDVKKAIAAIQARERLDALAGEPVKPEEFPRLLAGLRQKPSLTGLRLLALRLAKTQPTAAQKERHDKLVRARAAGAGKDELAKLEKDDEILQASRLLTLLLRGEGGRPADPLPAARAMRTWGTAENVDPLVRALSDADDRRAGDLRLTLCKALAAIGDPRGVPAVAELLTNPLRQDKGVTDVLISFGPVAEPEMIKVLQSGVLWTVKREACVVLKAVGTGKSLGALKEAAADRRNVLIKPQAEEAVRAIEGRQGKKGD
jgi:serine/threonine protein kinase/HEAT repeat protein